MPGVSALEFQPSPARHAGRPAATAAYRSTQPSRPGHVNELTAGRMRRASHQRSLAAVAGLLAGRRRPAALSWTPWWRVRRRVLGRRRQLHACEFGSSRSRQWPAGLLPMLISSQDWAGIEAGIRQRARMLNATLADVWPAPPAARRPAAD